MAKRKKKKELPLAPDKMKEVFNVYSETLETEDKYSLEVDPTDKYGLSDIQKKFIIYYVNFHDVLTASQYADIDPADGQNWLLMYPVQQEIRRLNLALYHRQFRQKLLDLDEIGGYLTCQLTGDGVPEHERLSASEKLKVVDLMIQLNKLKSQALEDPSALSSRNIEIDFKDLSIKTITRMLNESENVVDVTPIPVNNDLSPEEKARLRTLSTDELKALINKMENQNTIYKEEENKKDGVQN